MCSNERLPGSLSFSVWRWIDPELFEDIADGLIRHFVAKIRQSSLDPIESPGSVLLRESNDKLLDLIRDWRASRSLPALIAVIPLLGNQ